MNFISPPSIRPGRLRKPVVYFAGRMNLCAECDASDWRHAIVGHDVLPDDMDHTVGPNTVVEFGSFLYGGPFLIDGTGGHATGHCHKAQIARADLFIAWIDDLQAFGTLVEIGLAVGLRKPIVLGSRQLSKKTAGELWFAQMAACQVIRAVSPREFWRELVASDWLDGRRS